MQIMRLTEHQRTEWARAAQAFYRRGANAEGHALSAAAAKGTIPIGDYDRLHSIFGAWLTFNDPFLMTETDIDSALETLGVL